MEPTESVRELRDEILAQGDISREEPELLWARSWLSTGSEPWHIVRRATATANVLGGITPEIGAHDLLLGRFSSRSLTPKEHAELEHWRGDARRGVPPVYGQRAHMAIDYEALLSLGLCGLSRRIQCYRSRLDPIQPGEMERDAFYRACLIALGGLETLSLRYAAEAGRQARLLADQARRAELTELSAICRWVPEHPARTFHEALQSVHFVTFCLCASQQMLLFQLGRPDRYLIELYRRDIEAGRLTADKAQQLVDHLCLMLSTYTPRGLAVGFMIGGKDASGADVSNELTGLLLESIAHTRLSYPGIGLCWNDGTPEDIKNRACELLVDGLTHPAIFGDEAITRAMGVAGLASPEACLYTHSTCVELTPVASSNVYVASPYINLVQLLHDIIGVPSLGDADEASPSPVVGGGALVTGWDGNDDDLST